MPPRTVICPICNAENRDVIHINQPCYNCNNYMVVGSRRENENKPGADRKGCYSIRKLFEEMYFVSCSLPYLILLVGCFLYADAPGDKGWTIIAYFLVAFVLILVNVVIGIPVLISGFNNNQLKLKVVIAYVLVALLPGFFVIYSFLYRHK